MPWRDAYALHIYVPNNTPYDPDNWVDQVLGEVIHPIYTEFQEEIRWMWVTRYAKPYDPAAPPSGVPNQLPDRFILNGNYRHVLFRVSVQETVRQRLHQQSLELSTQAGCFIDGGWSEWDIVASPGGLGTDRFVKPDATPEERATRAYLVVNFVDATVKLMLDSLIRDDDGRWRLEPNQHNLNPYHSFFESVRHLFANATQVPNRVFLSIQDGYLYVGTVYGGWERVSVDETFPRRVVEGPNVQIVPEEFVPIEPHEPQWVEFPRYLVFQNEDGENVILATKALRF